MDSVAVFREQADAARRLLQACYAGEFRRAVDILDNAGDPAGVAWLLASWAAFWAREQALTPAELMAVTERHACRSSSRRPYQHAQYRIRP